MDFLSSLAKGGDQPNNPDHQADKPSSNSGLFASAKVIADAAQAQFRNEPEKYDKTKVAAAAADLLGSASEYGHLDETKGAGKYLEQAENYLRKYNTSGSSAAAPDSDRHKTAKEKTTPTATVTETAGGSAGDYVKMAKGFLNKPLDGESNKKSESGYGDLMKMAGGFFKK